MKRIINGIIIFVVCVGIGAFSIINNKDTLLYSPWNSLGQNT